MADRRISKRLKGKVMSTCVTPACLYGTETLALTELQQQRLQVCKHNWVRKIARVTRADRRRIAVLSCLWLPVNMFYYQPYNNLLGAVYRYNMHVAETICGNYSVFGLGLIRWLLTG